MNIFDAIIQALIQGFTEFLPISSSGHLSLTQHFLGVNGEGAVTFSIVLHMGTLVAVFIAFWDTISSLILEFFAIIADIFRGRFKWSTMNPKRRMIIMIIISIIPLFGFYMLKDFFSGLAEDDDIIIEGIGFLYTSALLLLAGKPRGRKIAKDTRIKDAVTVGIFQGIALVPGISRSGSTVCAGLLSGFSREYAVEYSFILGIPVILAGALSELLAIGSATAVTATSKGIVYMAVGFAVAAVSGFFAIRLIKWLVKTDKFRAFGWYTLVLGLVVIVLGLIERTVGWRLTF